MGARKRDSLAAVSSSESQMTFTRFMQLFPDNRACLDYLRDKFYPEGSDCPMCGKATKFHAVKGRSAYACQYCRGQVYPTAGTIFHKSTTSLQLWFWAIFLLSSTRCGISAKQLEREIGVSYPTAHRMFKQIRSLLSDANEPPLSGDVEMDETLIGGKPRLGQVKDRYEGRMWAERKAKVFGMKQRGGQVRAFVVPDRTSETLGSHAVKHVLPSSMIFTDEFPLYKGVGKRFAGHKRVNHSAGVYVDGDASTNQIEGFFGLVKTGIRGVYHNVSREYLQNYLDEYSFRFNRRDGRVQIFWAILDRVQKGPGLASS